MDIFLIVIGCLCLLVGFIGCIVPMLPGPPIAYLSLVLLHFTERASFSIGQLFIWFFLVVIIQIFDHFIPILGVKHLGGTRWGNWGCAIGTVLGIIVFPPWGILIGPFLGAVIGELLGGKTTELALRAGFGAFMGFILGTVLKMSLCGWFIYCFIHALI